MWLDLRVPEVAQVLQVSLESQVLMVHQDHQAAKDSKVPLDHWDFMDWMD